MDKSDNVKYDVPLNTMFLRVSEALAEPFIVTVLLAEDPLIEPNSTDGTW